MSDTQLTKWHVAKRIAAENEGIEMSNEEFQAKIDEAWELERDVLVAGDAIN